MSTEVITFPKKAKPVKSKAEKSPKKIDPKLLPEVNIGTAGHVDHGKTTLTAALTGRWTDTHSEEIRRGITIRLGYAETTFYKCPKCRGPQCWGTTEKCIHCFGECRPARTVSFVDAPGHETLMTTVLSGASLMDGALLIIAADEPCPQPQTREHLTALDIIGIKNIVVVQNKIDLVSEKEIRENYRQIRAFLKGSMAEKAPIIPVSAQQRINLDALVQAIEDTIKTPKRDFQKEPRMPIARSFDVNKPGTPIEKLKGAVLGGALAQGELKVGEKVEIRPGPKVKGSYRPVQTRITGLQKAMKDLKSAAPGGLLGLSTELDPYLAKSDALSGNILGLPGKLPPVLDELDLETKLLERVIGSREELKVEPIKMEEPLMMTVGVVRTVGTVVSARSGTVTIKLKLPVCADKGERVAISRQVLGRWRLIGFGEIT
jgi:translation initiation factor 2 subunit 3